jgi:hypothetical protein
MRDSTKPDKRIIKKLSAFFIVILGITFIWIVLSEQSNALQTPATPTAIPGIGFVLQIPQKALWKNYVTVSAEANPGTICELLYVPPSGQAQQMDSLADATGKCIWRWKIDESHGKGNGRLIFTIDGKSETHFIEIRSSF